MFSSHLIELKCVLSWQPNSSVKLTPTKIQQTCNHQLFLHQSSATSSFSHHSHLSLISYLLPKVVAVTAVGMTQFLVQIKVVIVEKWAGHRKRTDQSLPL